MDKIIWKRHDALDGHLSNGWFDVEEFVWQALEQQEYTGRLELLLNGTGFKNKLDRLKFSPSLLKAAMKKIYNHLPVPRNHSIFLEIDIVKSMVIEVRFTPK